MLLNSAKIINTNTPLLNFKIMFNNTFVNLNYTNTILSNVSY